MATTIHLGAKVKVVSGGRYLGKEGKVAAMIPHGPAGFFKVLIDGSFPRSANKTRQEFMVSDLKLLENAPGVVEIPRSEIANEGPILPGQVVFNRGTPAITYQPAAKPQGGQHTASTPLPTKADDAELASFCTSEEPDCCEAMETPDGNCAACGKKMDPDGGLSIVVPFKKEGEQSRPFPKTPVMSKASAACVAETCGTSSPVTTPDARQSNQWAHVVGAPSASKSATPFGGGGLDARLASRSAAAAVVDDSPHLIVRARAGTGKTTTLVHGVKRVLGLPSDLIPSPQQAAVWEAMEQSSGRVRTIAFCAFNKGIAEELKTKLPSGCEAATLHSLGFRVVKNAFGKVVSVNQYRVSNIISELKKKDVYALRRDEGPLLTVTDRLVGLCKMNLIDASDFVVDPESEIDDKDQLRDFWTEKLTRLVNHYDIDMDGLKSRVEVFELVPQVLEMCKDVRRDNAIDYDDMIWLPVVLELPVTKFDMLLVDEAQDLNRCQQALARMYGKRLILCGDDRQAIYGFAGADADSLPRMGRELGETERGCEELPLTVTRRCGKAIVERAQRIVPDFEAFESNPEGLISSAWYPGPLVPTSGSFMARAADGDFVLCRCNAPLVSTCFKFLRAGRKAQIQGRDIGQGLISTIKKLKAASIVELQSKLDKWLTGERAKENAKTNPSEDKLIALDDRYDCLAAFMENAQTVDETIRKIESVFTDQKDRPGIKLSSIHRSKGLEADRVFLLQLKKASVPHPMARTAWGQEQEKNLLYVAMTRAIHELVIVTEHP